MSALAPFQSISEVFERGVSIRHVYGDPVQHGDTTVIPVAKVAFGFGAGLGRRPTSEASSPDAEGGGGGGGARLSPVGALEIGPHGTRFIRYRPLPDLLGAFAFGLGVGLLVSRGRR